MNDWTSSWTKAVALALSAPTRGPVLASPAAAALLAACLEDAVARHDLPLLAWLVLPDGLHVVGARSSPIPWTAAIGHVKQAFSHRARRLPSPPAGALWRPDVRVRPLGDGDLPRALQALHALPVTAHLCRSAEDWRWSSARQAARTAVADRVAI